MNTDKIILENRFTTHQKISLLLYIGAPFIISIFALARIDLNYKGYLMLTLFILIYGLIICLSFTKRGFIKYNSDLYRGLFFKDKLILKKRIDLTDRPKISILKHRKSQKLAFFSAARPDLATEFNSFDINILNDKHTKREEIMSLKDNTNVEKTIQFLTSNFNLKNEIFSPDFR